MICEIILQIYSFPFTISNFYVNSRQMCKKLPFEHMLKDPKNYPMSVRMLKDPKNDPLSVCSRTQKMTLSAYAQGHIFVVHFHMEGTYGAT